MGHSMSTSNLDYPCAQQPPVEPCPIQQDYLQIPSQASGGVAAFLYITGRTNSTRFEALPANSKQPSPEQRSAQLQNISHQSRVSLQLHTSATLKTIEILSMKWWFAISMKRFAKTSVNQD